MKDPAAARSYSLEIPPRYTEYVGLHLLAALPVEEAVRVAA